MAQIFSYNSDSVKLMRGASPALFKIMTKEKISEKKQEWIIFAKYVTSGATSVVLQFSFLYLFVNLFVLNATFSSTLAYVLTTVILYLMLYHWAFKSDGRHHIIALRYAFSSTLMLGLNFFIFWVMNEPLQIWYMYSQVAASTIVALVNYLVNRLYTFS